MKKIFGIALIAIVLNGCAQSDPEDVLGRVGDVVNFSGYVWDVKYNEYQVGPGPNYFSRFYEDVFVDEDSGYLGGYMAKVGYDKVPELIDYLFYMGNIYEVTGQIDKAISYFNRTAAAKEGTNRTWFVINAYDHLAHIYKLKNDFPRALWYFQKTLVTAQQYHYPDWEILSKAANRCREIV
mgnify:CR=1 FL=1